MVKKVGHEPRELNKVKRDVKREVIVNVELTQAAAEKKIHSSGYSGKSLKGRKFTVMSASPAVRVYMQYVPRAGKKY